MTAPYLTPRRVAELLAVKVDTVLGWIHRGELRATNVARQAGGRPRWRIARHDLDQFLAARGNRPSPKPARKRRRDPAVVEFY